MEIKPQKAASNASDFFYELTRGDGLQTVGTGMALGQLLKCAGLVCYIHTESFRYRLPQVNAYSKIHWYIMLQRDYGQLPDLS